MGVDRPVAFKARNCARTPGRFVVYPPFHSGSLFLGQGFALAAPAWGKCWLSILNVYDWDRNNPIPRGSSTTPSNTASQPHYSYISLLRVLPERIPFRPHRWWIRYRVVRLPMCCLYGIQFLTEETYLILSLREVRLYDCPKILH